MMGNCLDPVRALLLATAIMIMPSIILAENLDVVYQNGRVTCHASEVKLTDFLIELTEAANFQLVIVEPLGHGDQICADFERKPLEAVLKDILKGYSYAIIIQNSEENKAGLLSYSSGNGGGDEGSNSLNEDEASETNVRIGCQTPASAAVDNRELLSSKIEALRHRIESGVSDREYDKWVQYRDPKYLVHDRERIKRYENRLSQLGK